MTKRDAFQFKRFLKSSSSLTHFLPRKPSNLGKNCSFYFWKISPAMLPSSPNKNAVSSSNFIGFLITFETSFFNTSLWMLLAHTERLSRENYLFRPFLHPNHFDCFLHFSLRVHIHSNWESWLCLRVHIFLIC